VIAQAITPCLCIRQQQYHCLLGRRFMPRAARGRVTMCGFTVRHRVDREDDAFVFHEACRLGCEGFVFCLPEQYG
jgi:hypothetical protein